MDSIWILSFSAAIIGLLHTLAGPDHYLPFILMARAGKWTLKKTTIITLLCGLGHVLGSVMLGIIGIILGLVLTQLNLIETFRGELAAWAIIVFGLLYFVWGMKKAYYKQPHIHFHRHEKGIRHAHLHHHAEKHAHVHEENGKLTPWILFLIFILGPCEPLIPILMYPAAQVNILGLVMVFSIFGITTLAAMLGAVLLGYKGLSLLPLGKMERFIHAIAGFTIVLSGSAIKLFGL